MDLTDPYDVPEPRLRARMLAAAMAARAPARTPMADPIETFRRQLERLDEVIAALPADAWPARTAAGWDVQGLVAHLTEVERYFGSLLGLWDYQPPDGTEHDHRAMTEPAVASSADQEPGATRDAWRARRDQLLAALESAALPDHINFHGLPMSTRAAFTTRAFEVWTHADDIRKAHHIALETPRADEVALMANTAVRSVPLGLLLSGFDRGDHAIRVVLTGPGGGTWVVPLGDRAPSEPDTVLVANAVDFCRMAAQRLDVNDLELYVEGDAAVAHDVLVGARIFAA